MNKLGNKYHFMHSKFFKPVPKQLEGKSYLISGHFSFRWIDKNRIIIDLSGGWPDND